MPLTPDMRFVIVPYQKGYRVMSSDGAFFSNHALTLKMAKRQQRALYAKAKQGHIFHGGSYTYMFHNGEPHFIMRGEGFLGNFWSKVKQVANKVVSTVSNVAQRIGAVSKGIRNDYQPRAREVLAKYGNARVTSLLIRREPVQSMINKALNIITLGRWNQAKSEMPYDKLFHLSMVATCQTDDGQNIPIIVEKNEVIRVDTNYDINDRMEFVTVPVPFQLTLRGMLDRAQERAGDNYFKYDAFQNNCQDFINNILTANGLNSPEVEAFVKQDVATLLEKLPSYTSPLANIATNIGGLANVAMYGEGQKKKKLLRGGDIDWKYLAKKFLSTSMGIGLGTNVWAILHHATTADIPQQIMVSIVSAILAGVGTERIVKYLSRRFGLNEEAEADLEEALDDIADNPALQEIVVDATREQAPAEEHHQQPAPHIAIEVAPEPVAVAVRAPEPAPERSAVSVRNPLREIPRGAIAVASPRREEVAIEMPTMSFPNPMYKGRGKKQQIVMKPKDFFNEHKKLVDLLNSIGTKLQSEAKEQASEAKGWKKKLMRGGIVLKGGVIDKASYLKRQSSGMYPKDLTYEAFVAQQTGEANRVASEVQALKESNKQYEELIKQNPEYENVVCKIGADLEPAKGREVVPKAVCDERHRLRNKKIDEATPFGKIMKGITTVGDTIMKIAPVPQPLKTAWSVGKELAGVGKPKKEKWIQQAVKTMKKGAFTKQALREGETPKELMKEVLAHPEGFSKTTKKRAQFLKNVLKGKGKEPQQTLTKKLEEFDISPALYLRRVRARAKKAGYDPKKLSFADDNKHKLMMVADDGRIVKFGSAINGDFILHSNKSKEEGLKAQKAYLARATKIKGNWKDDKFSPNSLAISILW